MTQLNGKKIQMVYNDERVFSGNRCVEMIETTNSKIVTGMNFVDKIVYHTPMGEGDTHFADVYLLNNEVQRYFDLKCVVWRNDPC